MNKIEVLSHAKINLTLDVLGRKDNGYHQVEMIMQTIDLVDRLSFLRTLDQITIETDHPKVPTDESNLIYQAAEILFTEFKIEGGLKIKLEKNIPVAAGLAGGSGNAAATLVAVNRLYNLGLTNKELAIRAAKLGADIPFCIEGGTQLATGVGTDLERLVKVPDLYLILVNPSFSVGTAKVYQNLDLTNINPEELHSKAVIQGIKKNNKEMIINNLYNRLENSTFELYPTVKNLKKRLVELSDKAIMSGSGPTVLGFVKDFKTAEEIKKILDQELPGEYRILTTKTINEGIKVI